MTKNKSGLNILLHSAECNIRERGSKFLGFIFPCHNEDEFSEGLNQLRSKYPDASHHCYAWRINPNNIREFSSDAGEPSGTAGLPILNQLKSFDVINVGAVVVRYFGGTKLGKAGLIESYGSTTAECLKNAHLKPVIPVQIFKITYPYSEENVINKFKLSYDLSVLESEYLEVVKLNVACPIKLAKQFEQEISKLAHLEIEYDSLEHSFIAR